MSCIWGGWAVSLFLLGWAFTLLTWPDSFRDSTYPLPDWLCTPERKRLRFALALSAGLGLLALGVPFAAVMARAAVSELWLTVALVGVALLLLGLMPAADPPRRAAAHPLDGVLPVRGQWVPYLLIVLGLFAFTAAWLLLPG